MNLFIKLIAFKPAYTIGHLFIDHGNNNLEYFCDTLGDTFRDLTKEKKIFGKTHIPCGTYKMTLEYSPKYKCLVPLLHDVPQFSKIEIHWGNDENDTDGCILVGKNNIKGRVTNSKNTFENLMDILGDSGQKEWNITIDK